MNNPPWHFRINGPMGNMTRERREKIAKLRSDGYSLSRIAEIVELDERKVRYHVAALIAQGKCSPKPPGRPRLRCA